MNSEVILWFAGAAILSGFISPFVLWRISRKQNVINVRVDGKLDVIHTLVNSEKTLALQDKLDGLVRELVLLRMVVALHRADGAEPSTEALAEIANTETKIVELKRLLAERLVQAETAKGQQEQQAAAAAAAG
jgi:EAL domain-containing protein (putative c-di-GMP-specific phosphodiesterase class I)